MSVFRRNRARRGFTLLELSIALGILIATIAAVTYLFAMTNGTLRQITLVADEQEAARLGLEALVQDLRQAGMGFNNGQLGVAPGGSTAPARRIPAIYSGPDITITEPNGGTVVTNSIFILSSLNASIGPPINNNTAAMGVVTAASATTPLTIQCWTAAGGSPVDCGTSGLIPSSLPPLIVGDFHNAVYLTPTVLGPLGGTPQVQSLSYAEQVANAYAPDPKAPFGFVPGATIGQAYVVHYYLRQTAGQLPQLVRSIPTLTTSALGSVCQSTDAPFLDETNGGTAVGQVIGTGPLENLQIRFVTDPTGSDTPANFTMVSSIGICDTTVPVTVRGVRIQTLAIAKDNQQQLGEAQGVNPGRNPTPFNPQYSTPAFEGATPTPPAGGGPALDARPRRAFSMTVVPRNLQGARL